MRQHSQIKSLPARRSYRYEDFFTSLQEAQARASKRSLNTFKNLFIMFNAEQGEWMVNSHGVELKEWKMIDSYSRGQSVWL